MDRQIKIDAPFFQLFLIIYLAFLLGAGGTMRKRRRRFEKLEDRRLLAAYINEILYNPLFGDNSTEQYIELRGPADGVLNDGTYLVVVESEGAVDGPEGTIHGIFDLSGQSFGSNGFLVLLEQDSPFEALANEAANVLVSTEPEFGNLPGDIYQDSHDLSERLDFIYASNSFFLIESATPPELGDDIDTNSDGIIDAGGVYSNWQILDSLSTMWGLNDGHGYGDIVFVDRSGHNPNVTLQPGGIEVVVEGFGYVARVGNSTGSEPADWVAGTVKDENNDGLFYRLSGDIHGVPSPTHLHGRELDSIGSENFTGAVRAGFYEDVNNNNQFDEGTDSVIPGTFVFADSNGNGQRDSIETIIEPDLFPLETELNNLTPGVSITTAVTDNTIPGFDITNVEDDGTTTGQYIFAHANIGFFSTIRKLRMDFYRAADSVSIDVIGNSNSTPTYGRLEVFDANGNSLEMIRTSALGANQRQTLTISRPSGDIAWAVAFSDDEYLESSPFGKLDTLKFSVPEAMAESDANGFATLNYLDPGTYTVMPVPGSGSPYVFDPYVLDIANYENYDLTIPVRENTPPVFEPAELEVNEDADSSIEIGTIVANDDPQQTVQYTLLQGNDRFTIGAATGIVRLRSGVSLNYEAATEHEIRVRATDNGEIPLSAEKSFTITVDDVNEPPSIGNYTFEVTENADPGTVLGTVQGADEDGGFNGTLGYRIVGNNPADAVAINGITGEVTVNNSSIFDYEVREQLEITVQVFDSGSPSLSSEGTVTINIQNENEAPKITTTELPVGELLEEEGLVGTIAVTDPESNQSHTFDWADGFASDTFTIDESTGEIRLAVGASLDFASEPEHFLQVRATDSGSPAAFDEREVRVRVVDENNPPVINDIELSVAEQSAAGVSLGTLTASDADEGQTHVFAIVAGDGRLYFDVDRDSGEITVSNRAVLDYETTPTLEIVAQVWDSGEPFQSTSRTLIVEVLNVNEPPTLEVSDLNLPEDSPTGTLFGTLAAEDNDGDELTYGIVDGPYSEIFTIADGGNALQLLDDSVINYESQVEYPLTIWVTDNNSDPIEVDVTVSISDVNDPPVVVNDLDPVTSLAGYALSTEIDLSVIQDEDDGQTLTWKLEAVSGDLPGWIQFSTDPPMITGTPWNQNSGEIPLRLIATDNGQPAKSAMVDFLMTIEANETPWTNLDNPLDTDGDGDIRPLDALVVINFLNRENGKLIPWDINYRPNFLDANGNNRVEPIDALVVINELNRRSSGEGEQGVASLFASRTSATLAGPIPQSDWDAGLVGWLHEDDEDRD